VIQAEQNAITQYNKIINLCEQRDYVTQEMAIQILATSRTITANFRSGWLTV